MSEYMSIKEVARYLGISERTAHRRAAEVGFPPSYEIGRLVRWRRSEIDRHMETLRKQPHLIPAGVDPTLLGGRAAGPRRRRAA